MGPVPRRGPFETYARTALSRLHGPPRTTAPGREEAEEAEALEAEVQAAVALYAAHAASSAPNCCASGWGCWHTTFLPDLAA